MASLAEAYNTYIDVDRTSDLNRLIDLAAYTAETWPDHEQGDTARMTLGQIHHGTGHYPKAIEAYESVRPNSPKYVDARTRAGGLALGAEPVAPRQGKAAEADAEVDKAVDVSTGPSRPARTRAPRRPTRG